MEENNIQFAKRLLKAMELREMTYKSLEKAAQPFCAALNATISIPDLIHYASGEGLPSSDHLQILASALQVQPVWLMSGNGPMERVSEPTTVKSVKNNVLMENKEEPDPVAADSAGKASFGERLREAMDLRGMRQADLLRAVKPFSDAECVSISRAEMSMYCSGEHTPKATKRSILAKALNVSEAWLLGLDSTPPSALDIAEQKCLNLFRSISKEGQQNVLYILETIQKAEEKA